MLRQNFPGVPICSDIKDFTRDSISRTESPYANRVIDLLTAGPPCQPASQAGKQRGASDDRWLWPETFRVIREFHPQWCVLENVPGILALNGGMEFEHLLTTLEGEGYAVQSLIIPACAVNAKHRRDRVWIVAHANSRGNEAGRSEGSALSGAVVFERTGERIVGHAESGRQQEQRQSESNRTQWAGAECPSENVEPEPDVDFGVDGLSPGLDGGGIRLARGRGQVNGQTKETGGVRPDSLLSRAWRATNPQDFQGTHGRSQCVSQASLLQPKVYGESICQRHAIAFGLAQESYPVPWEELRVVWGYEESARPPHRRKLAERLAREHSDLARELSYFAPPPCSACWADGSWEAGLSRVAISVKNRVDRLKGLGNAIVPQVAYEIVKAISRAGRRPPAD